MLHRTKDTIRTSTTPGWLLAASSGLMLAACGGEGAEPGRSDAGFAGDTGTGVDGGPTWDGGTGEVESAQVGPEGGTVRLWNGDVTLDVPPGAVVEPITLSAERFVAPESSGLLPGATYDFGPDGAEFLRPLTVSFRIDPAPAGDPEELRVAKLVGDGVELQPTLPWDPDAKVLRAQLSSFSPYGPSRWVAGCGGSGPAPYFTATVHQDPRDVTLRWSGRGTSGSRLEFERAVVSAGAPCSCATPRARGCVEDASTPGRCFFNGLQNPQPSDWESLGTIAWSENELTDQRARTPGVYNYRVRTNWGDCKSSWSPSVRAVVLGPPERPADPTQVQVQPFACGGFRIDWSAVSNASGYEVLRKRRGTTEPHERVATVVATESSHVDTSVELEPGAEYEYRVSAFNAGGSSPGGTGATATNADAPFAMDLSHRYLRVAPGQRAEIGIEVQRHLRRRFDVELDFETIVPSGASAAQAGVEPLFIPRIVDLDDSRLRFDVDPDASSGLVVEGRIVATTTVSPQACHSAPIRLEVGEPYCRVQLPNLVLEPHDRSSFDFLIDRAGFDGLMDLSLESTDPSLPLTELGVFASLVPNPAERRGSVAIETTGFPFPDFRGEVRMTAQSQSHPSMTCEAYARLELDGGGTGPTCSDPLSVEIVAAEEHCETTIDWEGHTVRALEFAHDVESVYVYAETSRPVQKTEWALAAGYDHRPYVEDPQFGHEIQMPPDWTHGVAVRVTDRTCEPDQTAEEFVALITDDGVCD